MLDRIWNIVFGPRQKAIDIKRLSETEGVPFEPIQFADTPSENFGGTGKVGNWKLARKAALDYKIFLAGGLNPQNVAAAIHSVRPVGVDVSTGVEKVRGSKDPALIAEFVHAARVAGEEAFV